MDCKSVAIIKFSHEEILELQKIVQSNDFESALKALTKIDKKVNDFIEPH